MRSRLAVTTGALLVLSILGMGTAGAETPEGQLQLDLARCVDLAIEANTSVLKAQYSLDRSTNSVISSASNLLPSVGWGAGYGKAKQSSHDSLGTEFVTTTKGYNATLAVNENLSVPLALGLYQSLSTRVAVEENVRAARQQVAYTAKQKYLEVLRAQRLLVVNQEALDLSKRRLEKAQAMLEVGSGVKSDVLRAQVEVGTNELNLISARNALRLAETDLKAFLRVADSREVQLEDVLEPGATAYTLGGSLSDAMELRPDVRAGAATVRTDRAAVWQARGAWLPALSYSWSRDYASQDFPDRVGDVWDDSDWRWNLGISFSIADIVGTHLSVSNAKIQLKSSTEDLSQTRRDAALEVKQAFYKVEEAEQRVKVSTETVSLAEEELRLAEERYRLGGGTMLEQIDAQLALSQARISHVQALYDYLLSQAELARATGRD